MNKSILFYLFLSIFILSCTSSNQDSKKNKSMETFTKGTFGYDIDFLKKWDDQLIVLADGDASVAVSGKYQGKVFTSSMEGPSGSSMGWINYSAFGKTDPHMNAYGGENRFWLGPEGNKYSLFFPPGASLEFEHWKTPAPIDTEAWDIKNQDKQSVTFSKEMKLKNYAGEDFEIDVDRQISLLKKNQIESLLGSSISGLESVGYKTANSIKNIGNNAWNAETGAPCIWILDMFTPTDETTVVIPYRQEASGKVATTDYFGQIPSDRVRHSEGMLYFRADGKSRGKLGLSPQRSTNIGASYDAKNQVLTIAVFDVDHDAQYLNQEWNLTAPPYQGDAINAYNDGPLEDGSQMGPFYEIESVSPAAFLAPGESLSHDHSVIHLAGDRATLDQVSQKVIGINLLSIENAF